MSVSWAAAGQAAGARSICALADKSRARRCFDGETRRKAICRCYVGRTRSRVGGRTLASAAASSKWVGVPSGRDSSAVKHGIAVTSTMHNRQTSKGPPPPAAGLEERVELTLTYYEVPPVVSAMNFLGIAPSVQHSVAASHPFADPDPCLGRERSGPR